MCKLKIVSMAEANLLTTVMVQERFDNVYLITVYLKMMMKQL